MSSYLGLGLDLTSTFSIMVLYAFFSMNMLGLINDSLVHRMRFGVLMWVFEAELDLKTLEFLLLFASSATTTASTM